MQNHMVDFFINVVPFGICRATFVLTEGFQTLIVSDDDGDQIMLIDDSSESAAHLILLSRIYDALNAFDEEHAIKVLESYIETMDPFGDFRKQ